MGKYSREKRYMDFVQVNARQFGEEAPRCYREFGRGAFSVYLDHGPPECGYIADTTAREKLRGTGEGDSGWPDDATARMVATYDPETEFVLIVVETDGSISGRIVPTPVG
jgi:hypothetical protein